MATITGETITATWSDPPEARAAALENGERCITLGRDDECKAIGLDGARELVVVLVVALAECGDMTAIKILAEYFTPGEDEADAPESWHDREPML